jgi:hypothetical protein
MSNEYNEGDLVEASKNKERLSGVLVRDVGGPLKFHAGFHWHYPGDLINHDFTIAVIEQAKPKVELPTDVGFYLSRESKLWTLEVNGYWRDDYDYTRRPDEAEAYAPFTRLEPRAVTAKAALDFMDDNRHLSAAALAQKTARHFGVTL